MKKILLIVLGIFLSVSLANASTFIDFRPGDPFHDAHFAPSYGFTEGDFSFTLFAYDGSSISKLWHSVNLDSAGNPQYLDGFGIFASDYKVSEVNWPEFFEIRFDQPVMFHSAMLTDFAIEGPADARYSETGFYSINGVGLSDPFYATREYDGINKVDPTIIPINATGTSIFFTALGKISEEQFHEYSVGGIEVSQVPLPPAVLLLGSGMLGLAAVRRRMKS